jgi:hypothetical protein
MIVAEMVNCEGKTRRYNDLITELSSASRAELRRTSATAVPAMREPFDEIFRCNW